LIKYLLLFLFPYQVFASVVASVDSTNVELGEMVTYSLTISGKDVSRPNITRLCDTDVISTSSQTSINMINGNFSRSYVLSYKFIPQKTCVIPAMEVKISGKTELSNKVSLKVGAVIGAKDKDYVLELFVDKSDVYIGETFKLTLLFKQKNGSSAIDSEFIAPELKGFWVKDESKPLRYKENNYSISKVIYTMAAQREGDLDINKAQMRIASRSHSRDTWGAWIPKIKWKTYFSNSLILKVKALPNGVNLVGDFSIKALVIKNEINFNEAVNLSIEVVSDGNLEDIKSFKPSMSDVNVFDEKINILGTKLTQKMAFVSENNFVIPPFSLKFFNPETKEIKTVFTKEIKIRVKNAHTKEPLTIKREEKKSKVKEKLDMPKMDISTSIMIEIFLLGLVLGLALMYFKPWNLKANKKSVSIKDHKVLLTKLLAYKDDEEVQKIINILENNLYSDEKQELNKKQLRDLIKRYNIS